jgi:hypothetical protein
MRSFVFAACAAALLTSQIACEAPVDAKVEPPKNATLVGVVLDVRAAGPSNPDGSPQVGEDLKGCKLVVELQREEKTAWFWTSVPNPVRPVLEFDTFHNMDYCGNDAVIACAMRRQGDRVPIKVVQWKEDDGELRARLVWNVPGCDEIYGVFQP